MFGSGVGRTIHVQQSSTFKHKLSSCFPSFIEKLEGGFVHGCLGQGWVPSHLVLYGCLGENWIKYFSVVPLILNCKS